eukprot:g4320.t1
MFGPLLSGSLGDAPEDGRPDTNLLTVPDISAKGNLKFLRTLCCERGIKATKFSMVFIDVTASSNVQNPEDELITPEIWRKGLRSMNLNMSNSNFDILYQSVLDRTEDWKEGRITIRDAKHAVFGDPALAQKKALQRIRDKSAKSQKIHAARQGLDGPPLLSVPDNAEDQLTLLKDELQRKHIGEASFIAAMGARSMSVSFDEFCDGLRVLNIFATQNDYKKLFSSIFGGGIKGAKLLDMKEKLFDKLSKVKKKNKLTQEEKEEQRRKNIAKLKERLMTFYPADFLENDEILNTLLEMRGDVRTTIAYCRRKNAKRVLAEVNHFISNKKRRDISSGGRSDRHNSDKSHNFRRKNDIVINKSLNSRRNETLWRNQERAYLEHLKNMKGKIYIDEIVEGENPREKVMQLQEMDDDELEAMHEQAEYDLVRHSIVAPLIPHNGFRPDRPEYYHNELVMGPRAKTASAYGWDVPEVILPKFVAAPDLKHGMVPFDIKAKREESEIKRLLEKANRAKEEDKGELKKYTEKRKCDQQEHLLEVDENGVAFKSQIAYDSRGVKWEILKDKKGSVFYYNTETDRSKWKRPLDLRDGNLTLKQKSELKNLTRKAARKFRELDVNHDHVLSGSELVALGSWIWKNAPADFRPSISERHKLAQSILAEADADNNGRIDYEEFVAWFMKVAARRERRRFEEQQISNGGRSKSKKKHGRYHRQVKHLDAPERKHADVLIRKHVKRQKDSIDSPLSKALSKKPKSTRIRDPESSHLICTTKPAPRSRYEKVKFNHHQQQKTAKLFALHQNKISDQQNRRRLKEENARLAVENVIKKRRNVVLNRKAIKKREQRLRKEEIERLSAPPSRAGTAAVHWSTANSNMIKSGKANGPPMCESKFQTYSNAFPEMAQNRRLKGLDALKNVKLKYKQLAEMRKKRIAEIEKVRKKARRERGLTSEDADDDYVTAAVNDFIGVREIESKPFPDDEDDQIKWFREKVKGVGEMTFFSALDRQNNDNVTFQDFKLGVILLRIGMEEEDDDTFQKLFRVLAKEKNQYLAKGSAWRMMRKVYPLPKPKKIFGQGLGSDKEYFVYSGGIDTSTFVDVSPGVLTDKESLCKWLIMELRKRRIGENRFLGAISNRGRATCTCDEFADAFYKLNFPIRRPVLIEIFTILNNGNGRSANPLYLHSLLYPEDAKSLKIPSTNNRKEFVKPFNEDTVLLRLPDTNTDYVDFLKHELKQRCIGCARLTDAIGTREGTTSVSQFISGLNRLNVCLSDRDAKELYRSLNDGSLKKSDTTELCKKLFPPRPLVFNTPRPDDRPKTYIRNKQAEAAARIAQSNRERGDAERKDSSGFMKIPADVDVDDYEQLKVWFRAELAKKTAFEGRVVSICTVERDDSISIESFSEGIAMLGIRLPNEIISDLFYAINDTRENVSGEEFRMNLFPMGWRLPKIVATRPRTRTALRYLAMPKIQEDDDYFERDNSQERKDDEFVDSFIESMFSKVRRSPFLHTYETKRKDVTLPQLL